MDTPAGKSLPPRTVEVMTALENYTPTVPEELVQHYMRRNGDDGNDAQLMRFIGLAGERFLATIMADALQIAKRRQQMSLPARRQLGYATGSKKDDKKTTLLAEDVAEALKEFGISVRNAPYYLNH
eukprot:GHUV01005860.1.p2 GENE.GHUV01005860.1~~GHUV01005860.1.p2  ORF type:complete len:126 (+),score=45.39 GHUV01005860.1:121-498(+)